MKKILSVSLFGVSQLIGNELPDCSCAPVQDSECGCYPLPYYDLECNWGISIRGDFLYWSARESPFAYCLEATTLGNAGFPGNIDALAPIKSYFLPTKWDPGFRIGLGYETFCDGWDIQLLWTRFYTRVKAKASVPDDYNVGGDPRLPGINESCLINPWLNASVNSGTLFSFDIVSSEWNLRFNQIDFELGKRCWLSRCFTFRPYGGIRASWIRSNFYLDSQRNFSVVGIGGPAFFKDFLFAHTQGAGLLGGAQSCWFFSSNFSLFLNLDIALVWGQIDSKKKFHYILENGDIEGLFESTWKSNFFILQPVLDLGLGLRWEETWCSNRYRTSLDIGWEHHTWLKYLYRNKNSATFIDVSKTPPYVGFSSFSDSSADLNMIGLMVSAKFEF